MILVDRDSVYVGKEHEDILDGRAAITAFRDASIHAPCAGRNLDSDGRAVSHQRLAEKGLATLDFRFGHASLPDALYIHMTAWQAPERARSARRYK